LGAKMAAERLRSSCAQRKFGSDESPVIVTLSCGVGSYPDNKATSALELLNFADAALYESKRKGRDCVTSYHPGLISVQKDDDSGIQ